MHTSLSLESYSEGRPRVNVTSLSLEGAFSVSCRLAVRHLPSPLSPALLPPSPTPFLPTSRLVKGPRRTRRTPPTRNSYCRPWPRRCAGMRPARPRRGRALFSGPPGVIVVVVVVPAAAEVVAVLVVLFPLNSTSSGNNSVGLHTTAGDLRPSAPEAVLGPVHCAQVLLGEGRSTRSPAMVSDGRYRVTRGPDLLSRGMS